LWENLSHIQDSPGAPIEITFTYQPGPNLLRVQRFIDDKTAQNVPLNEGYFHVPEEQGIYYYGVSAFWQSSDGKYSEGDTSSAFVVEVK
jgi:hypothetical protein